MSQAFTRRFILVFSCLGALLAMDARGGNPPRAGALAPQDHLDRNRPTDRVVPSVPGELLVKFRADADPALEQALRVRLAHRTAARFRSGGERWILPQGIAPMQAIAELRDSGLVAYAEPNYLLGIQRTPNDPDYSLLWGLHNTGQTGGTAGADIRAEQTWDVTTGSGDVVVAVIDSGVDASHPDLAENLWTNPGEIPNNGVDDDQNGYVDDVHGWDFVNDDNDPFDDHSHGTHVAGTIGAIGNNGIGVTGVAWRVSILPLKFLASSGSGTTADAVLAVEYATAAGVDITNNSWGGGGFSQALLDAIVAGGEADVLFVAAAGNYGDDADTYPMYPAAYGADCIVSVAATGATDRLASFSNYGATSVDLAAPGVDTWSTIPGGAYGYKSGTSMATPHVSGVAALLRSLNPSMGVAFLKERILGTVAPVPELAGLVASGGRLDALRAVEGPDEVPPGSIDDLTVESIEATSVVLAWTATGDDGLEGTATRYDVRYSTSPLTAETIDAAPQWLTALRPSAPGNTDRVTVSGLLARTTYHFAVRAKDEWGNVGPLGATASGTTLPGTPEVTLLGARQEVASEATFNTSGAATTHVLVPPTPVAGEGIFTLVADGDYGDSSETATLSSEGTTIGQVGAVGSDCLRAQGTFPVEPAVLAALAADGTVAVTVQNSAYVDTFCSPNRHLVTLAYSEDPTRLDFGTVFLGARPVRTVRIANEGNDVLEIASISAGDPAFVPSAASLAVPAGATTSLDVVFAAAAEGTFASTLTLVTNDPDEANLTIEVVGVTIPAPGIALDPPSFEEALVTGESVERTLTLSNSGGSDLQVRIRTEAREAAGTAAQRPGAVASGRAGGGRTTLDAPGGGSGADDGPAGPRYADGEPPLRDPFPEDDGPVAADLPTDMRILLIGSASNLTEIRSQLLAFPDIVAVDTFSAEYATPTLDQLLAYRAVIVANNGTFNSPDALGNVLADYVDADGAVVLTSASYIAPWAVQGRFTREGYSPVASASGPSGSSSLGAYDASHPIFEGVTSLSGSLLGSVQLAGEATLVGQWASGAPLVATRGARVVLANVYVAMPGYWTGHAPALLRNAAFWASPASTWLRTDVTTATIPPAGTLDVRLTIDASDLFGGRYLAQVVVESNDPLRPIANVPVTLDVTGAPDIALEGELVSQTSRVDYSAYPATTRHDFPVSEVPVGGATVTLRVDGDYGSSYENATLTAEGNFLGSAGGAGSDCSPATLTVDLAAGAFASLVADGTASFSVANSWDVDLFCDVNRHEVTLSFHRAADRLDFGPLFIGLSATREIVVHNRGTQTLHVASIATEHPSFAATPASLDLAPRASARIRVDFTPTEPTLVAGTLTVTSDDPDEPTLVVALEGTGLVPPDVAWSPGAIGADLRTNERVDVPLTIRNEGGSPLEYRLRVEPLQAVATPPELAPQLPSGNDPAAIPPEVRPAEAAAAALPFRDDFEDGDYVGWVPTGYSTVEVVASTAAPGSLRSLRLSGSSGYHNSGVYQNFQSVRPRTISFWIRPGPLGSDTGYVALDGSVSDTPIFFFANAQGRFSLNSSSGFGDTSVVYVPGAWHRVEFRNVDFIARTFDYWVNGVPIRTGMSLWTNSNSSAIVRMNLYNYTPGSEAHWDEIVLSDTDVREWVALDPSMGTVQPGTSTDVLVGLDATDLGTGTLSATIELATNDPDEPEVEIPVELRVTGAPDIDLAGVASRSAAERPFTTYAAVSAVNLAVGTGPVASAVLRVTVHGDFEAYFETASVSVEGTYLGTIGGSGGTTCGAWSLDFPLSLAQFEAWRADGRVQVTFANTGSVDASCGDNRHGAELLLLDGSDRLDLGNLFVGQSRTATFAVRNVGTDPLNIASIAPDDPSVTVTPSSATIARGGSLDLTVVWSPVAPGPLASNVTIVSDDPDEGTVHLPVAGEALLPPDIEVDPTSIDVSLLTGQTTTVPVTIRNLGASDLVWSAAVASGSSGSILAAAPAVASGAGPAAEGDFAATAPPDPPAEQVGNLEAPGDPPAPGAAAFGTLEEILTGLDAAYRSITSLIPSRFDFSEGVAGSYIDDGGYDMYDGGNYLSTTWGGPLPYRDGTVTDSSLLGPGGRYFTRKYPGLFVFVGDFEGPDQFTISGNLGADGSGAADASILRLDGHGSTWRGYVKRVFNAGDPSVNHLIVVEAAAALTQDYATHTNDDFHRVRTIPARARVHYLLFASSNGGYVDDATMLRILEAYVTTLPSGGASVSPSAGVVPAGSETVVSVGFDAVGVDGGIYSSSLVLSSNDPDEPAVSVPLTMRVTGMPDIDLRFAERTPSSTSDFVGYGAQTTHTLAIANPGNTTATVEVAVEGDFSASWRDASVTADGIALGSVSGNVYCGVASRRFTIDAATFAQIAADGVVVVTVVNSSSVSPYCGTNRHTVTLNYRPNLDTLDFGELFLGRSATIPLEVANVGTDDLHVTAIDSNRAEVLATPGSMVVARRGSGRVEATFSPVVAGEVAGTLTVASDDPDEPLVSVPFRGVGILPPDIAVEPASIDLRVNTNDVATRTLSIANTGGSPLHWTLRLASPDVGTVLATAAPAPPDPAPLPATTAAVEAPSDPPASRIETLEAPAGPEGSAEIPASLEATLEAIDLGHEQVTSLIPSRFDFTGGVTGTSIEDGGANLFDGGNFLRTSLGGPIPYSDGVVRASSALGGTGSYFTRKYSGLFVFVGDFVSANEFTITGNLGANGYGRADGSILEHQAAGTTWRGYVKRVHGTSAPSVNHLVILGGGNRLSNGWSSWTDDDYHFVRPIATNTRVHYLLFASENGGYVDDATMLGILRAYVAVLSSRTFTTSARSGSVPAGESGTVDVTFDATGLEGGLYPATVEISSNDPDEPRVAVPMALTVTGVPDIVVRRPESSATSTNVFAWGSDRTSHRFAADPGASDGGTLEVQVQGNFSTGYVATVTTEGLQLGTVGGAPSYCGTATRRFTLDPATFAALAADGHVDVEIVNSPSVGAYCPVNTHTATLKHRPGLGTIDFGELFIGNAAETTLEIANTGTDLLEVSSIAGSDGDLTAAPPTLTVSRRSANPVVARLAPTAAGALSGTLDVSSNDPDEPVVRVPYRATAFVPPDIDVTPPRMDVSLFTGARVERALDIANTGESDLRFTLEIRPPAAVASVLGHLGPFPSTGRVPATKNLAELPFEPPAAEEVAASEPHAAESSAADPTFSPLEEILDAIERSHASITAAIPYRYDFTEGETGSSIGDGGGDLYDGGNFLATELAWQIGYTNGPIVANGAFGPGSRYFTRKVPGLFVLVADLDGIGQFVINGDLGADGYGAVDGSVIRFAQDGRSYLAFVKRVWAGGPPSVNHVVLVEEGPGLRHDFSTYSNSDYHAILGLDGSSRLHYLLFAGSGNGYIDDGAIETIVAAYLGVLPGSRIVPTVRSGIVPPGSSASVPVAFDAAGIGDYDLALDLAVHSNDPDESVVLIPATLHVTAAPDLVVEGAEISAESTLPFAQYGETTNHAFPVPPTTTGEIVVDTTVTGDFDDYWSEFAQVRAEGYVLGELGRGGVSCASSGGRFALRPEFVRSLVADGTVEIQVANSGGVDPSCPTNEHRVRLTYRQAADRTTFGPLFIGLSRVLPLRVSNGGFAPLHCSAAASGADFAIEVASIALAAGEVVELPVRFTPLTEGPLSGALTLTCDDPDEPTFVSVLSGVGVIPPDVEASPTAIAETLVLGETAAHAVIVRNTGGSDLVFSGTVLRDAAAAAPVPTVLILANNPLPWGSDAVQRLLAEQRIGYDLATIDEITNLDLGAYRRVIVPSDQSQTFYHSIRSSMHLLEEYVTAGGVLEFHAAGWGSQGGNPSFVVLPGGVGIQRSLAVNNYVLTPGHPLAAGLTSPLTGDYASVAYFYSLPAQTSVVLTEDPGFSRATLAVYPLGSGWVIAGSMTFEYGLDRGQPAGQALRNMIGWRIGRAREWFTPGSVPSTVVPPGGEASIDLGLDSGSLDPGTYEAVLDLATNDPDEPNVTIRATLEVVRLLAVAGPDQTLECTSAGSAAALLDGAASRHMDGADAIASYTWLWNETAIGEGPLAVVTLPLGANDVDLWIGDASGDLDSDRARVTVVDTMPPAGRLTAPSPGACFGPAALPVRLLDDVVDVCTTNLTRSYDVAGGPEYAGHGDHDVGLSVSDPSGNVVDAGRVRFTIDTLAPQASILVEPSGWIFPAVVPFQTFFTDGDDDGALGAVVHERITIDGCTFYDGLTFGDRDGLLLDETLPFDADAVCRLARMCGRTQWTNPVVAVEATDCGGNVTRVSFTKPGGFSATHCP